MNSSLLNVVKLVLTNLSPFGKKRLKALERQIYRSMYDGDVLREPVAKLQSAEISLTKDNFLGDAMNAITKQFLLSSKLLCSHVCWVLLLNLV